jgi:predicted AlkP superfamily pyrophosphatase or phosphodiesterase
MMDWTAGLATSETPPDLIVTEILLPDSLQHKAGYKGDLAHWSMSFADGLVAQLLNRLERARRSGEYTLAIMSDHGHSQIDKAFYPEVIIPGTVFLSEGSTLHVVPKK